jgi:zinc/manganese transport system substrate-binding protein
VQPGLPGHFEAARHVAMLEVPTRLDRADGDVHAAGNPHIQTDPRHFLKIGEALASRMAELDPANAAAYQGNYKAFAAKWRSAIARWEAQAAPLRGANVVVQHSSFTYLLNWLGLKQLATLEPKPGLEPSAAYLGEVLGRVKAQAPRFVLRAAYNSPRPAEWFSEQAHVPVAVLPFTVGGDDAANDLFGLFDDTVQRLLKAAKP